MPLYNSSNTNSIFINKQPQFNIIKQDILFKKEKKSIS